MRPGVAVAWLVFGGAIAFLVAEFHRCAHRLGDVAVISDQALDHLARRDEIVVVVGDGLDGADVRDAPNRRAANAAYALGERVDRGEQLISLLVEEQIALSLASGRPGWEWSGYFGPEPTESSGCEEGLSQVPQDVSVPPACTDHR